MEASDVYTDPPPSSYITNRIFTHPRDGRGIKAIAFDDSFQPFLFAAFAILVQLVFMGIWNLVTEAVVALYPSRGRVNILGLVVLYNSREPWSAIPASFSYLVGLIRQTRKWKKQHSPDRIYASRATIVRAAGLFLLPVLIAGASLAASIKYLEWMQLPGAAPVEPSAIFVPYKPSYDIIDTLRYTSLSRPSTMRALSIAEATELNTKQSLVNVSYTSFGEDARIDYNYQITAAEFGLQSNLGLKLVVQGSCRTEYSWIHPTPNRTHNDYWIFGNSSQSITQPGPRYPSIYSLGFNQFFDTGNSPTIETLNYSFALIPEVSCVLSTTPGTDPLYRTERLTDVYKDLPPSLRDSRPMSTVDYRIRPGRPPLSCWEDSRFCNGNDCRALSAWGGSIPDGLFNIFSFHFMLSKLQHVAMMAGPSALRIGFGSSRNAMVDAGAGSLQKDMKRLILAAYFASKEAFRDISLFERDREFTNWALGVDGQLHPGAADFIIRTKSVITVRLDLLIVAPALAVGLGLLSWLIHWLRKKAGGRWTFFKTRARAIGAPQLFRMLDERISIGPRWERELHDVPVPADPWAQPEPKIWYEGTGKAIRPLIIYEGDPEEVVQLTRVETLDRSHNNDSRDGDLEQMSFLDNNIRDSAIGLPAVDSSASS